jgi:hypothetical protein
MILSPHSKMSLLSYLLYSISKNSLIQKNLIIMSYFPFIFIMFCAPLFHLLSLIISLILLFKFSALIFLFYYYLLHKIVTNIILNY